MYLDNACCRRRRKLATSGLGDRDCWAITVDAQRLQAGRWSDHAIDSYIDHAISLYRRFRRLDMGAQQKMEAIEWQFSTLPANELVARLEKSLPMYELSDKKLLRLWELNVNQRKNFCKLRGYGNIDR